MMGFSMEMSSLELHSCKMMGEVENVDGLLDVSTMYGLWLYVRGVEDLVLVMVMVFNLVKKEEVVVVGNVNFKK